MKNFTYKNLLEILKSKGVLAISGSVLLVSCGAQMGGYTETDGVYYDPNKDVIPEGIVMQEPGQNVVDEPYNYQSDSVSIIEQNKQNQLAQQNKYRNWSNNNNSQSDWGSYAGTEQNIYYNNYNWGYPYYGWSLGFSFGSSWGYSPYWGNYYWGGYYPGYYGYYSPWYYNSYYPYYGGYYGYNPYYYGGYYHPWYGYYSPYYGGYYGYNPYYYGGYYYPRNNYKRSGADAITRGNGFQNSGSNRGFNRVAPNTQNNQNSPRGNDGFRRSGFGNQNPNGVTPQQPQQPSNRGFRRTSDYTPSQQPTYSTPRNDNHRSGSDNGGFRSSGGFGGGSSSSGSSSRSSSGGGFRSGGFR